MYSLEQRKKAVELYIAYCHNGEAVMKELGYPSSSNMVKRWYQEGFFEIDPLLARGRTNGYFYSNDDKVRAVEYYLDHNRNLAKTVRDLSVSRSGLTKWIDEFAPGQRRCARGSLEFQKVGKFRTSEGEMEEMPMDENEELRLMEEKVRKVEEQLAEAKRQLDITEEQLAQKKMELSLAAQSHELLKKSPGVDLRNLTNREKALLVDALRKEYELSVLLRYLGLPRSSYFYQRKAIDKPDKYACVRERIKELFIKLNRRFGYRTIWAFLRREGMKISEKVVRRIMAEESLEIVLKRRRGYSSYTGEADPSANNIIKRDFAADAPNVKWLTDLTEFKISAGKAYLSPIIDCFDGKVVSWTVGTSPNAALVNDMLDSAIDSLKEDEHPIVHSDRGCHYRWPGWIERMEAAKLTRSMSKKGCSPDNAACEGFFGRLKNEFFYFRSWKGVSLKEFAEELHGYIHWYNEKRIKKSLGWMSPTEYRISKGLMV